MTAKKKLILSLLLFFVGLILGLVIFFPLNRVKTMIAAQASKATGYDVEIAKISFGSGLGLGLSKGGILGIQLESLNIVGNTGKSLSCKKALIAPHFTRLIFLQLSFGILCDMDDSEKGSSKKGSLNASIRVSPIYSPSSLNVEAELDEIDLVPLIEFARPMVPETTDLTGVISGRLELENFAIGAAVSENSKTELDLSLSQFVLNNLELGGAPLFSMPFNMGKTQIFGNLSDGTLSLSKLDFQSEELNGNMNLELKMNKQGLPQSGVLKGKIKTVGTNPNRDLTSFLENFFGPIDNSEYREFTKKFEDGNIMGFLGQPKE